MKPITKQTVKPALKFVTVGLLIGLLIGAFIAYGQSPDSTFTISSGVYPGAPSYTVWREGSEFFAKDANGLLAYSGTDASAVIQAAINAVPGGRIFLTKSMGRTTLHTGLVSALTGNLNIEGESTWATWESWLLFDGPGACFSLSAVGYSINLKHIGVEPLATGLCAIDLAGASNSRIEDVLIVGDPINWAVAVYMSGATRFNGSAFVSASHMNHLINVVCSATLAETSLPIIALKMDGGVLCNNKFDHCWFGGGTNNTGKGVYMIGGQVALNTFTACTIWSAGISLHIVDSGQNNFFGCDIEAVVTGKTVQIDYGSLNLFIGGCLTGSANITFGAGIWNKIFGAFMGPNDAWGLSENSVSATNATATTFVFNHSLVSTATNVQCSFNFTGWTSWTWTSTTTQVTVTITGALPAAMTCYAKVEYAP